MKHRTTGRSGSRWTALLLSICMVLTCAAGTAASAYAESSQPKQESLKIASLSDTHVLANKLMKNTEDFQTDNAVGRIFDEGMGVIDAQLEAIKKQKPDVLLVSGDLTKDGELESHEQLAERLQKFKKEVPGVKVYVINGNHDINNENAKNYNTKDGKRTDATRTTPEKFRKAWKSVYDDPSVIARYTPPEGKTAGCESYAARIKDGYTLIAIDTCRYSSDNSGTGKDEHNTSGQITKDLANWVLKQIAAAKKRGDTVIGMSHHNFVPHFTFETVMAVDYVVRDWEKYATEFADAGMHYIFTGHYHAQDVSKFTTKKGNDLYEVETGSAIGYPAPYRITTLSRSTGSDGKRTEHIAGNSYEHLKATYTSKLDGRKHTIDDATEYTKNFYAGPNGVNESMVNANVYGYVLRDLFDKLEDHDIKLTDTEVKSIYKWIDDTVEIKVSKDGHNPMDVFNYSYSRHIDGTDHGPRASWYEEALDNIATGEPVADLVETFIKGLGTMGRTFAAELLKTIFPQSAMTLYGLSTQDDIINPILRGNPLSKSICRTIGQFLKDWSDSISIDTNYPDDNTFSATEVERADGTMNDGSPAPYPGNTDHSAVNNLMTAIMTKVGDYV